MRAKACVRCRQWKVGCDADTAGPEGCSRCVSIGTPCVFNRNFQRTPKRKRLAELQSEIERLRQLAGTGASGEAQAVPSARFNTDQTASSSGLTVPSPGSSLAVDASATLPSPSATLDSRAASWTRNDPTASRGHPAPVLPATGQRNLLGYKSVGDVQVGTAQARELFRIYLTRCHPSLPFAFSTTVCDEVYACCPLLFWSICAAASADGDECVDSLRARLDQPVRELVAGALDPVQGSVETVQALLILCVWPFPFLDQKSDPSFLYIGMATQMAQQIGLHRPEWSFDGAGTGAPQVPSSVTTASSPSSPQVGQGSNVEAVRMTTWMACFVVNQMMSSRLGVPSTLLADHSLLEAMHRADTPRPLGWLCAVSHLAAESAQAVGARAANSSGLADPAVRTSLLLVFARQFDELGGGSGGADVTEVGTTPRLCSDGEELFLLAARLQLWSFALHDDMPMSADLFHILHRARQDAIRLIQVACEKNLALVPFYTCRSVVLAALVLYQIALSPYAGGGEGGESDLALLEGHIRRACRALGVLKGGPDLAQFLETVTSPENRGAFLEAREARSSHRWKMGASLLYDSRRTFFRVLQSRFYFCPEIFDLDAFMAEDWGDLGVRPGRGSYIGGVVTE